MNGEDITQFNIRSFYGHSTRRRTIPSHNISSSCSINKALSEAKTLLKRERKSTNKDREQSEHLIKRGKENINQPRTE